MVSLLVCSKDVAESKVLYSELTNDKGYEIENVSNKNDVLTKYWQINPDILVLDSDLVDLSIDNLMDRLSCSPTEQKKCNTILIVPENTNVKISNVSKVNKMLYKPFLYDELVDTIKTMSTNFNTPDFEYGELDWLLLSLDFNSMSPGYRLMKDAITYYYYKPYELDSLSNVLHHLAYKYKIPETRVRDALKSCLRPFNRKKHNIPNELQTALYSDNNTVSLKDFLERIVFYLVKIKKKGRNF